VAADGGSAGELRDDVTRCSGLVVVVVLGGSVSARVSVALHSTTPVGMPFASMTTRSRRTSWRTPICQYCSYENGGRRIAVAGPGSTVMARSEVDLPGWRVVDVHVSEQVLSGGFQLRGIEGSEGEGVAS
jgi:hypothetical protein